MTGGPVTPTEHRPPRCQAEETRQQRGIDPAPPTGRALADQPARHRRVWGQQPPHRLRRHRAGGSRPKAAEIRERIADGRPARDRRETVAAFAQHWIDTSLQASERKRNTKVMYAGVARIHILDSSIGRLSLDKVRPSHVEGWVVELRRKGLAESTIRSAYTILRAVLDTAVRDGALASKPAAVIRRPRVTSKEAPYLTSPQVAELLRAAEGSRYAPLFAFRAHRPAPRRSTGPAVARRRSRRGGAAGARDPVSHRRRAAGHRAEDGEVQAVRADLRTSGGVLRDLHAAQTEERSRAGSAWRQTGFVSPRSSASPAIRATPSARSRSRQRGRACRTWACTRSGTRRPA